MMNNQSIRRKLTAVLASAAVASTMLTGCSGTGNRVEANSSAKAAQSVNADSSVSMTPATESDSSDSLAAVSQGDPLTAESAFDKDNPSEWLQDILMSDLTDSSVVLNVPQILQNPELPTGCEATSLTIALQSFGCDVDKTTIARDYLPYSDNCAVGFAGDPFSPNGAGIFPSGLSKAAEKYIKKNNLPMAAINTTGTTLTNLYKLVQAGYPVLVWTTMFMASPTVTDTTYTDGSYTYQWYSDEHCVVLYGYDQDTNQVYISDPLVGLVARDASAFESIFDTIGQYSMVLSDGVGVQRNNANVPSASGSGQDYSQLQQQYTEIQDSRQNTQSQTYENYQPPVSSDTDSDSDDDSDSSSADTQDTNGDDTDSSSDTGTQADSSTSADSSAAEGTDSSDSGAGAADDSNNGTDAAPQSAADTADPSAAAGNTPAAPAQDSGNMGGSVSNTGNGAGDSNGGSGADYSSPDSTGTAADTGANTQ